MGLFLLAGLGLAFTVFIIIATVYMSVSVIEYCVDEKISTGKTALMVLQLVVFMVFSYAVTVGLGWLLLQPLAKALDICSGV